MPIDYRPELILDSGAYTNFKSAENAAQGRKIAAGFKPITREEYADFLDREGHRFVGYFNMDVIVREREDAARLSHDNYAYLRKRGLQPIPVYHQGEDLRWLYQMLDDGAEYIALAGASTLRSKDKERRWYDLIWNALVNKGGLPTVKVHALGDTKEASLSSYPWFSADSSSWAQGPGRSGTFPMWVGDRAITLSVRKDGRTVGKDRDIDSLVGRERQQLIDSLADYGFDFERMLERRSEDHIFRLFLGLMFYRNLELRVAKQPRPKVNVSSLFGITRQRDAPAIPTTAPKIFLASWLSHEFTAVFKLSRYPHLLISYAWLREEAKAIHARELWGEKVVHGQYGGMKNGEKK